ncbi:aminoglycoside phosphotransferase [uncultured Friedmanniella sp.]|uniref:maltokinase N-terminal cap-like domain-containing protein n=1 Tax=uncultured Friedmanniella sp. TaxID=335381 RepID=UPI0035CBA83E
MPPTTSLAPETADHLLAHLSAARWFGGKGRRAVVIGLTPLPWLTSTAEYLDSAHGLAVRPEVLEVGYPMDSGSGNGGDPGPRELYQLVVAYRHAPQPDLQHAEIGRWTDPELGAVVAYDAMQDPEASSVVLQSLLAERTLRQPEAQVGFHLSAAEGLSADLPASVFKGQQSNTSVMFGEVAMLKVFRRLELGRNLDIEVHDALSRTSMADVAKLYGWVDASWSHTDPATGHTETLDADLAMVVEKLADATDGWGLALDVLGRGTSFAEPARELGHALAETHAALRTAFPSGLQPGAEVAQVMTDRLGVAAAIAPALEPYVAGLQHLFADLGATELTTQRVHGDFHLGQTLHTPTGWKIIDFEGEPAKTLVERAAPDSVWRDIAGMLRSFDYAAASVPGPGSREWAQECRTAFLTGYAGGELTADDAETLRAYEADKAVYEVVYEVRNRPEWVAIPLGAVGTLVGEIQHDQARDADQDQARDADQDQARDADQDQARDADEDQARDATQRRGASNQVKE